MRAGRMALIGAVSTMGLAAACAPMTPVILPPSPITFTTHVVDPLLLGPSFVSYADALPGQGDEVIVSQFGKPPGGPGTVGIYQRTDATLDNWVRTEVVTPADGIRFPNEATVTDLDGDGDQDVVVTGGFFLCAVTPPFTGCGTLAWFERTPGGYIRHDILTNQTNFYHKAIIVDIDLDGIRDLVTIGETFTSAVVQWFKGDNSPNRFQTTPRLIGYGGGSLPEVRDVDGDGDLDVISAQYFASGRSFAWWERTADPSLANPDGVWVDHTITSVPGPSFEIRFVEDLRGPGQDAWLATNHVNTTFNGGSPVAGVWELDPAGNPTGIWNATVISQGIVARPTGPTTLAPGTFNTGDIDGDGLIDIAVSGDGDPRLFWMKQLIDGSFQTYVMAEDMGQGGGGSVADLNGDGKADVAFSSYEQNVVKIYSAN